MAKKKAAAKTDGKRRSKKGPFLAAFRQTACVASAARAAKINRDTHYQWLKADPEYAAAFAEAEEEAVELLEEEARRRAMAGSDTMLIFMLKAAKPEVYCDRHRHLVDGNIATTGQVRLFLPHNGREPLPPGVDLESIDAGALPSIPSSDTERTPQ